MPESEDIEVRSYEVQDVVGAVPPWIVRWGSALILIIVIMMLVLSYVIKYPDIVSARVLITSTEPPVDLITKTSGKITQLLVRDNEDCDSAEVMAVIESVADYRYVLYLDSLLDHSTDSSLLNLGTGIFDQSRQLGELQTDYSALLKSIEEQQYFADANYKDQQSDKVNRELEYQENLQRSYVNQKRSLSRESELALQKFNNDKALFKKGVISARELNETEANYLRVKNQIDNIDINISNAKISSENLRRQLTDLLNNSGTEQVNKRLALIDALNNMRSRIEAWKNTYLITAPMSGKVSLHSYKNANLFIEAGKVIMTVVPPNDEFIGRIQLPMQSSGKVKVGQDVIIKLDNFPYQEFGSLDGTVTSISSVPKENNYLVEVSLTDRTNYDSRIDLKQEMQGTGDIITQDKRLFEKIFNQFRYLYKRNK